MLPLHPIALGSVWSSVQCTHWQFHEASGLRIAMPVPDSEKANTLNRVIAKQTSEESNPPQKLIAQQPKLNMQ